MVAALRFVHSDFGLILIAIRDHEVRCRYLGIHTPLIKTVVFTACNGVAAAVGVLYALYSAVVAPSLVGFVLATNVLIWVTLGGRGTIVGPVIAAVLVNAATPQLSTWIPLYWQGALGLLFVLVVVGMPRGLLPGVWEGVTWLFRLARTAVANGILARPAQRAKGPAALDALVVAETSSVAGADEALTFDPPPAARQDDDVVLDIGEVSKRFGSFHALTEVSLQVRRGELVSIVGPNGAGKTSLVRCITDGQERTAGVISVGGHSIGPRLANAFGSLAGRADSPRFGCASRA
jgi:branched-chain amino acid transport system permease protein